MVSSAKLLGFGAFLPLLVACNPEFDNRFSKVDAPRVLAVQSSPAEAAPLKPVSYRILVVNDAGTLAEPRVNWSYCTQTKPISELNDVAQECFQSGDQVVPFGSGTMPTGTIPDSACRQFGPDIPQTKPGEPPGRPADADSSGGYFQPVILAVAAGTENISTLAETRITCGLANSGAEQLLEYRSRTKTNENPELTSVLVTSSKNAPLTEETEATPLSVRPGELVTLRASWPACPSEPTCGDGMCTSGESVATCADDCTTPVGCRGPEEYAYLDPATLTLVARHESMRVSWFTTQGEFEDDHTGQLEQDFAVTSSDNEWRAPSTLGPVSMWVVLRDARGGVDWRSYRLQVE